MKKIFENAKTSLKQKYQLLKTKRTLEATTATVITIMFIVAIIVINTITGVIGNKVSLNIDLTSSKLYTLSDSTKDFIKNFDKQVEINVLNTKQNFSTGISEVEGSGRYYSQASNIIDQYAVYSDKIKVNYIDTVKDPNFISKYPNDQLYYNDIILDYGNNHKVINSFDLFEVGSNTSGSYSIKSSKADQVITSAIMALTSDEKIKATFLTGYSESDSNSLKTLLENNNYDVTETNVLTGQVDSQTKLVFIYGPRKDYDETGITKLKEFIKNSNDNGVTIVYLPSTDSGDTPKINSFLEDYGVSVSMGKVYSTDKNTLIQLYSNGQYSFSDYYTKCNYVDEKYKEHQDTSAPVLVPESKPIEVKDSSIASVLLNVPKGGIAKSDTDKTDKDDVAVATISSKKTSENSSKSNNVIVIGSDKALGEGTILSTSLNNPEYFTSIFNTLAEKPQDTVVEGKSAVNSELGITVIQAYSIGIIFALVLPLVILIYGIVVWARRRHR